MSGTCLAVPTCERGGVKESRVSEDYRRAGWQHSSLVGEPASSHK